VWPLKPGRWLFFGGGERGFGDGAVTGRRRRRERQEAIPARAPHGAEASAETGTSESNLNATPTGSRAAISSSRPSSSCRDGGAANQHIASQEKGGGETEQERAPHGGRSATRSGDQGSGPWFGELEQDLRGRSRRIPLGEGEERGAVFRRRFPIVASPRCRCRFEPAPAPAGAPFLEE